MIDNDTTTTNPFGITREEILNLAAEKLADQHGDFDDINTLAQKTICQRVDEYFAATVKSKIDTYLAETMHKLVSTEIAPVNIWGEKTGEPTTLRDAMAEKARDYWNVVVNDDGKPSDRWGAKLTRAEWLMKKIVGEEFSAAMKQNLTDIVGTFKDALRIQAQKDIGEHLNKILAVKTKQD